ncbi:MAG: hypothetical protein L6U61_05875 [Bacteroidales bacterium]|nr:MAG: hypothetical protein L6U61_05875 [Bacteroidales bacterium]
MNNRFFLGAVAALSIVSANAERLLDSADNCLVVDNEPMVFGSMVSNKAWTTAEQQTAGLGLYRFFGYTVDAKPVVLSTDFQIESAAYKRHLLYRVDSQCRHRRRCKAARTSDCLRARPGHHVGNCADNQHPQFSRQHCLQSCRRQDVLLLCQRVDGVVYGVWHV